ncbi:DnaJ subfamily B member 14 [Phytophthora cinnamomi]|uniref:DnaJ subfamily B member 14 n=1 Tax=Phytophthora cinnamomi TaxID=4785 RepID=UPI00355A362E|nr:DnaJ subfamily B member 14 [Phytophthora cinnamomi]
MTRSKYLQPNYYDILGVDRSASTDDIKAAYRKLVLEHHPDRRRSTPKALSRRSKGEDAAILRINAAYNSLSRDSARSKYDMEMFGVSAAPGHTDRVVVGTGNYKPMSSEDVHELFGGLNEFERFTTAQYHRQRSHIAPAAIGRRATNFAERKQFRAANVKLPTQSATMAWLAFPVALMALWGLNLKSIQNQSKKY